MLGTQVPLVELAREVAKSRGSTGKSWPAIWKVRLCGVVQGNWPPFPRVVLIEEMRSDGPRISEFPVSIRAEMEIFDEIREDLGSGLPSK